MPKMLMRLVVALVGLFNIGLGLVFLVHPAEMAAKFSLQPIGSQGLATIRADFTAFFLVGGLFAILGAWKMSAEPLKVPILLLAIALFGRTVSLVFDGVAPTAFPPMITEGVMIAILVAAQRVFSKA
ncbi:DUF4345 family protein [Sandaracinobacteroides hominis]|uniref:DUF4345 family protein n=1 Tax=Sandaracinobacteroides hominis TaxID=2780086 RepID=UPI0018F66BB3|nr:DUF4345 family protein [Sandaracinobacteroides hominis]